MAISKTEQSIQRVPIGKPYLRVEEVPLLVRTREADMKVIIRRTDLRKLSGPELAVYTQAIAQELLVRYRPQGYDEVRRCLEVASNTFIYDPVAEGMSRTIGVVSDIRGDLVYYTETTTEAMASVAFGM